MVNLQKSLITLSNIKLSVKHITYVQTVQKGSPINRKISLILPVYNPNLRTQQNKNFVAFIA